ARKGDLVLFIAAKNSGPIVSRPLPLTSRIAEDAGSSSAGPRSLNPASSGESFENLTVEQGGPGGTFVVVRIYRMSPRASNRAPSSCRPSNRARHVHREVSVH